MLITSRIHSALPAVAFGTPVLFLSDGLEHPNQKSRLEGMESFFKVIHTKELNKESSQIPLPIAVPFEVIKKFNEVIQEFLKE